MKRFIVVASLCVLASSVMAVTNPASAQIRINANLSTGQIYFDNEPNVVLVPGTQVYYTPYGNYEVYRYRRHWYASRNGMWYRASDSGGPYYEVDSDRVPPAILAVPGDYRQQFYQRNYNNEWRYRHRRYHNDWDDNNDSYRHRD